MYHAFMLSERITAARGRKYLGVNELAEAAGQLLQDNAPLQSKGTVTAVPDERTVRFYLSEGLLDSASERQGTASIFGYLHLLQLLVVKKLQSEHTPLRQIKTFLAGRSVADLEHWLGVAGATASADNDAMSFLEGLLAQPPRPATPPPNFPRKTTTVPPSLITQPGVWRRYELAEGLELHIREDLVPPASDAAQRVAENVRALLKAHTTKK